MYNMAIKSIKWFVPLELNHSSYVYTSLVEYSKVNKCNLEVSYKNLNKKGKISVEYENLEYSSHWYTKVTYVEIQNNDLKKIRIAFDLNDSPYEFSTYSLENCDIVFKRSYIEKFIVCLPEKYKEKIRPMGLPFMVRPDEFLFKNKIVLLFLLFRSRQLVKFDRLILNRFKYLISDTYKRCEIILKTRRVSDFNVLKTMNLSNNIFFQKRLFPNEFDEDTKEVHKQRVRLIRLLKSEFSKYFIGGLKNAPPMTDKYEDCISEIDGDAKVFLDKMKSCGICIYTRGLSFSTGWTLPEFLSQGKCVVAEKGEMVFPNPLVDNIHVIYFDSDESLVKICSELIKDQNKIEMLGRNALDYYEKEINPSIFFNNILSEIEWKKY